MMRSILSCFIVLVVVVAVVVAQSPVQPPTKPVPTASIVSPSPLNNVPTPNGVPAPPGEVFEQLIPIKGGGPSPRHNSAVGYNPDKNTFFVIGGANGTNSTGDVWVYDLSNDVWSQVTGVVADIYGAAWGQTAASYKVWLYGGVNSSGLPQNSISQFDVTDNKIVVLPNSAPNPDLNIATAGVTGCVGESDQYFHVFGGDIGGITCSNQLATFDIKNSTWQVWNVSALNASQVPSPRDGASIIDYNQTIILFGGGCSNTMATSDVWRFSYKTGLWSKDKPNGKPALARRDHVAYLDPTLPNPQMVVFGGLGANGEILNDLWTYDLVKMTWQKMRPSVLPEPRKDPAGVYALGRLLLFGGAGNAGQNFNDLWEFVHQEDCFIYQTCGTCSSVDGCGWCWDNAKGFHCVSGSHNDLYVTGSCQGYPSATAFSTDPLVCPSSGFPSWAIALIVIGGVVIIGIIVFAIMKMRKSSEYEEIQ